MIYPEDYRTEIERVEAGSVACVVSSPPFWTAHGTQECGGNPPRWGGGPPAHSPLILDGNQA